MESSGMDTVQDTSQKVEGEEKPKVTTQSEKAVATTADKTVKPARPAVGSSAAAKTKTVESQAPPDPDWSVWGARGLPTCEDTAGRFHRSRLGRNRHEQVPILADRRVIDTSWSCEPHQRPQ